MKIIYLVVCISLVFGCDQSVHNDTLFTRVPENKTGISFRNLLQEADERFNVMLNPYFYNGGGVAAGDINNDGLIDLCFTGNMVKNRLYLNKGDFKFEDITDQSGIASKEGWCTGITMVDINGDGWLDIYICRSGLQNPSFRKNLLFINNGRLGFSEKAAEYGLDDAGYSTQASFFDYDKDGDLDMFLINESTPDYSRGMLEYAQLRNKKADSIYGNKLFRNDKGLFTDISSVAGIQSNVLTFSLGLSTADINMDGWPDIYVANDFNEQDYLYINNHNGTFSEKLQQEIDHTSQYSMGCDVADYNNDGLPDIFTLDMLPENNHDLKMHMGGDNYDKFNMLFSQGYYYQYMKNSLQKNNGDGSFSEIGQLAGIAATDWSWSPLCGDFDNDGLKDLFITNGYKKDNTNMQFVKYTIDEATRMKQGGDPVKIVDYVAKMPGIHIENYIYQNTGNDHFEKKIKEWGFDEKTFSHGAAYADLDNDGDLDIITNNTEDFAGIYRNNAEEKSTGHHLSFMLKGNAENAAGIGAKVFAYAAGHKWYVEELPVRGFQSSSDTKLHIGLGDISILDSVRVIWPNDATQMLTSVKADQLLRFDISNASVNDNPGNITAPVYFRPETNVINYTHYENNENDFTRQFLLPHFYSHNGPCIAKSDINGDGLEDLFIGGAKGFCAAIFIQTKNHSFIKINEPSLQADSSCEDMDAVFFDADNDNDADLYIVSGGYEFDEHSPQLNDRLYINNGKGIFTKQTNALPQNTDSKSCARPYDIDGDGDMDIFIGGKIIPGKWPFACSSKIYVNNGKGKFIDETEKWNAALLSAGIVTDAAWLDINGDKRMDLVIVGEWMAPTFYINDGMKLVAATNPDQPAKAGGASWNLPEARGWWNTMLAADFDGDGDDDLVMGNYGLNSPLKPSAKEPVELFTTDIDGNGSPDPILTSYVEGKSYPFYMMDDINGQVPILKKNFYDYEVYAKATIAEIIPPGKLNDVQHLVADNFSTLYLENTPKGFVKHDLPIEAQYAPVYSITAADVNRDGKKDIILLGNNKYNRIRLGRHDANHGTVLLNNGNNKFSYMPAVQNGLHIKADCRSSLMIGDILFVGVNNEKMQTYSLR